MKVSMTLNSSQYSELVRMITNVDYKKDNATAIEHEAVKEIIWNLYVKLGRRIPNLKTQNKITLSAAESWALSCIIKHIKNPGLYQVQLSNYITGIVHQKLL